MSFMSNLCDDQVDKIVSCEFHEAKGLNKALLKFQIYVEKQLVWNHRVLLNLTLIT